MPSKPWWKSKTQWVNILSTIAGIGATLGVIPALGPVAGGALAVSGVANIILRSITTQPITLTSTPAK